MKIGTVRFNRQRYTLHLNYMQFIVHEITDFDETANVHAQGCVFAKICVGLLIITMLKKPLTRNHEETSIIGG